MVVYFIFCYAIDERAMYLFLCYFFATAPTAWIEGNTL
jgi:hypothetical protein